MRLAFFAFFVFLGSLLRAAPPSDPSLLLWLPFDESGSSFAADRSSNALEADLSNVQWVSGSFGTAVRFGGTNVFVEIPPVPGFNGATQFTLSVWATWEGPAGHYPNLLTTHTWSPGGLMLFVADNACSFRMGRPGERSGAPGNQWTETSAPLLGPLPQRQWTHLCVTFALPEITTYVNGQPVGRAAWPYPVEADGLRLGGWSGPSCHNGLMNDLRIYSCALSAAEVAALAHDPTRIRADYAAAAPEKPQPPAAVFKNRWVALTVDTQGRAASLRTRGTGRELLAQPQPLVSATLKSGQRLTARSVASRGDSLIFTFPQKLGTATVAVDDQRDFFTFKVRALTLTNAAALTFCELAAIPTKYRGNMASMLSDDADAVCLRGYDLPVEMGIRGNVLSAGTTAEHGLVGWRAGLAAGPKSEMPAMLRAMARTAGAPTSKVGGPWSLDAEANRGSYLFADLTHASTDDWIELARRGGFSTLHLCPWWRTLGHYDVSTNLFPLGLADLRDSAARIHAAGLRVGIHTLTACIEPDDPWIASEANTNLIAAHTYTLARPLATADTVLYVNERPADDHDLVFTYMSNGNAIRIGSEIVQYEGLSRTPPYAFSKCTRGAFKTRPAAHAAGERADYLQQLYIAFYPQPDSTLAADLADHIARVFNTCELDQIYFDGAEGMGSRYGIDAMRHAIFKRLNGNPLVESSCDGEHNWWYRSRFGTWDHPVWAAKRFQDLHIATCAQHRHTDLLGPQMGWWAPRTPTPLARGHFLDEMEYFACKNLGLDAAMSIQGVSVSAEPLPFHIEKQFTLLGWYEHLRLARYFDAPTVARVAKPGDEFRLRQNRDGAWQFTPVKMDAHRISCLGNGSEAWTGDNPYGAQPLCARIEALYAVAPYESPARVPLADAADFAAFKADTASPAVTLALAETTDDVRGGSRNLRLRAENGGSSRTGAWARATLEFPAPYRSLGSSGAFGVWIKGDGKGALLNLQLGTPREFMFALSDHYVTLDFTGWRYVELLVRERDVERFNDYVWPYGGSYDLYRNPLDLAHISHVALYLNDLPAGGSVDVTLSPVMALPVQSAVLKNPRLGVNGQTVALPFELASGDFAEIEPDGTCTRYSDAGDPLATARLAPLPALKDGANALTFDCERPQGVSARAEVTLSAFGAPFGTPNPRRKVGWQHVAREYDMPRLITAPDSPDNAWEIAVRPNAKVRLEIELCGALASPELTVGARTLRFPVALKAGERLLCRDGRHWAVLDAKHATVAQGELDEKVPKLEAGTTRVSLACASADRARVKLVKVYD